MGDCYGGTTVGSLSQYPTTAADGSHTRHEVSNVAVDESLYKGSDVSSICSHLLEEQTSLATRPGQQSLIHGYSEGSPTSVPNTPPPFPAPKPYPTGPHQSGMPLPWYGLRNDTSISFLGARQRAEENRTGRYPAGFWATQGSRKIKNAEGEFQCRPCILLHGEKRVFKSTNSLRNHERRFHEKPRKIGTKVRKVSNHPRKSKQERFVFEEGNAVDGEEE